MKKGAFLQKTWIFLAFFVMLGGILLFPGKVRAASSEHYLYPYATFGTVSNYTGDQESSFKMMGVSYNHGMVMNAISWGPYAVYNLDGKVDSVSFLTGPLDGASVGDTALKVYVDGTLVKTVSCTGTMSTQTVSVTTANAKQLQVRWDSYGGRYCIANVIAHGSNYHSYESKMTKSVSVIQDGERTYTCSQCGYSYTETVPMQTWCEVYLTPYQAKGYTSYTKVDGTDDSFKVMGKSYYEGLVGSGDAMYNLNQEYTSVTFSVGYSSEYRSATLSIYCDGNLMETASFVDTDVAKTFTVNTSGVSQLRINLSSNMAIYEMSGTKVDSTPKSHTYEDETLLEASAGKTGLVRHTCKDCGATYTETTAALPTPTPTAGASTTESGTSGVYTVGKLRYKITSSSAQTVSVVGPTKKTLTSVSIPSTVYINGATYKVTAIAKKAFRNNKKLKNVVIGANLQTIGASAFSGDTKLTKITIKSTQLKSVGKNALKKTKKNITIKVPSSCKTKYKKLFKNKGQSKIRVR